MFDKKRVLAFVFVVFIVFVMFLSSAFIISHAEHNCADEGCPICATLCVCEESLKTLALAVIAGILFFTRFSALCGAFFRTTRAFSVVTPVSLKVKRSN